MWCGGFGGGVGCVVGGLVGEADPLGVAHKLRLVSIDVRLHPKMMGFLLVPFQN